MRIFRKLKVVWLKISLFLFTSLASAFALADDGIIPIDGDEQIKSGESFITVIERIIGKFMLPIECALALLIIITSIMTLTHGVKKAREDHKSEPLMTAVTIVVVTVVIGGALIYLLQQVAKKVPT